MISTESAAVSVLGRRWILAPWVSPAGDLARDLKVSRLLGNLLWQRGLKTPEAAQQFLEPRLQSLGDPLELTDMAAAADHLLAAMDHGRSIVIYGDYDVDGITSSALLWRVLGRLGARVTTFLPHRMDEGYGLSQDGAERCVAECRPELLVAVDCGTTAVESIAWLRTQGVDTIVVDHHEMPRALPACVALVNPHRDGRCMYLASVGLTFKLCHAILKRRPALQSRVDLRDYLDLVAVGTVADIVPLVEENRVFVRRGLRQITQSIHPGLRALCEVTRIRGIPSTSDIGFRIGPRLNASGRLGDATRSLALLQTNDPAEAALLARQLESHNRERQTVEQRTHDEALGELASAFDSASDMTIVLAREGWHVGVIGIVASRIQRLHHRPVVIIGIDPETGCGKGSCRSIDGLSMVEALRACDSHLLKYGGHAMAAGLTLRSEQLPAFRKAFNQFAAERLSPKDLCPQVNISGVVPCGCLTEKLYREIEMLAPFGRDNPEPVFAFSDVEFRRPPQCFGNRHFKLFLRTGEGETEGVAFGLADHPLPAEGFALAGSLDWSDYSDRLQLRVMDWCARDMLSALGA
jgi:single-stranded-DNA-specific exonuclease